MRAAADGSGGRTDTRPSHGPARHADTRTWRRTVEQTLDVYASAIRAPQVMGQGRRGA